MTTPTQTRTPRPPEYSEDARELHVAAQKAHRIATYLSAQASLAVRDQQARKPRDRQRQNALILAADVTTLRTPPGI